MKAELTQEGLKATPPVAVTLAWMSGLTINDAVGYATLIYVVLQAGYLLWKWYGEIKKRK